MSIFEDELKNGRFVVGECTKCHKVIWPPGDFCSNCFGVLSWRPVKEPGVIVEWSAKDNKLFCLVEFEKAIRVIGIISGGEPKPGQKIRISSCGFDNSPKLVFAVV
jgi:hypothetical protein